METTSHTVGSLLMWLKFWSYLIPTALAGAQEAGIQLDMQVMEIELRNM